VSDPDSPARIISLAVLAFAAGMAAMIVVGLLAVSVL
jgi:hypothetical protein